jgi:RNA polymerase sigma-70 factor (ECF subfamily)
MSVPQDNPSEDSHHSAPGRFASTHWSVVLAAAQTQSPEAQQALETLCKAYWYPLYAYLRRKGYGPPAAEDLTQDFFARRVVTKLIFRGVQPGRGKFRTWLLNSLQNLALNERDRQQALKRGGDQPHCSLDLQDAEGRYLTDPGHGLTPEKIYERTWAMTLLDHALAQLETHCEQEGKATLFAELKCYLPGALSSRPYADVAARLGKSEEALKMAVSRLRQQYGQLVRAEIKRTVSSPTEVQEELRHLLAALAD